MDALNIDAPNTSIAWLRAVRHLLNCGGDCSNLMVQIDSPIDIETPTHQAHELLLRRHNLLTTKQVVYTIFPHSLYRHVNRDAAKLFEAYNRSGGVYDRLQRWYPRRAGWGSYFRRMTWYPTIDRQRNVVVTNQLENLLHMLQERNNVYKAAYTISTQLPGIDGKRTRGGPCLNYLALQLRHPRMLDVLAVFRSHDFVQRAYGNYLGLGYLMEFLCEHTGYRIGKLSCLSSYASISDLGGHDSWPTIAELRLVVAGLEQL